MAAYSAVTFLFFKRLSNVTPKLMIGAQTAKALRSIHATAQYFHDLKEDIVQGFDSGFEIIVKRLTGQPDLDIVTITGMGGIGKNNTFAKKACRYLQSNHHFDIYVWVTISQQFQRVEMCC
ncbi:hypothetical protein HAX54_025030 [Datura stramonium]|uniref:NB-ARC domain-containing protein n=1 Tax=Datura stramonium TaxID=4076 RepID=A0ABS8UYU1_DATST|nr:hypothetical protein [Datura stramonium]